MQLQIEDIINEYSMRISNVMNEMVMKEATIKAKDREIEALQKQIEELTRKEEMAKVKGNSKK